jgi:H+-transporting ATPase
MAALMDQKAVPEDPKELSVNVLMEKLSSTKDGLSVKESADRLQVYGPNEIIEKKVSPLLKLLSNFWGPIPLMIEVAAVLSFAIGRIEDFLIIVVLLIINVGVKFYQESKAGDSIELLKQRLAPNARVKRDGLWAVIPARELVPGDVVRIRLGDIVPADVKLISGQFLQVDESALTGESLPVEKHPDDVSYSGSIVRQGEMDAMVVSTGAATYFGKTAKLAESINRPSHFQKAIVKIGDYLIVITLLLVALITVVGIYRQENILEILQFALVLTIAGIPVALPAVLSVTMAIGAIALAKKEAIVSKLTAIEEMASMDILCADKTGTITENKIRVADTVLFNGHSEKDVLLYAALASREENNDSIDMAVIERSRSALGDSAMPDGYKVVDFKPFDPVTKHTEATVENASGGRFKVAKGAPQVILAMSFENATLADGVNGQVEAFAKNGYRALGVALTGSDGVWHFAGLISLHDPPREDSAETIRMAVDMGLDVKMVTGDHVAIAREVGKKVGMGDGIYPESAIEGLSDAKAQDVVEHANGFAQVFPEHKYRIVELLQAKGHIVGMTGDGVNDVPALQKADAGIAVAGATDAAKSAADIVLTRPGISVIIDAVKESRKIFQRMTNYSIYRMGETIRLVFFVTVAIIAFNFYPITPLMIVLLALLNDFPIMAISYDNVLYSNKPERWNMRALLTISTIMGLIGVVFSFGLLYIGMDVFHLGPGVLQSLIYLKLSVAGHLFLLVARTRKNFWSVKPAPILLAMIIGTQSIATILTVYGILLPAMGWGLALFVWGYCLAAFIITDFIKLAAYRLVDRDGTVFHT